MLGQLYNKIYNYELFLCDFNKNIISCINYSEINYSPRFKDYNELEFSIEYYENHILKKKDNNFDLTKAGYLVLMEIKENDTIIKQEYFTIDNPNSQIESDGKILKSCHCFSYPYIIFNMRKLRGYTEQVRTLYDTVNSYDFNDNTKGGILNLLLENYLYGTWTVNYINPKFLGVYHTFSFSENSYTDVLQQLEKDFNCIIIKDSVNNELNIYDPSELGVNQGLVISKETYLKSLSTSNQITELTTRLFVTGKDSASINKYNPIGMSYVEDYSYFLNNGYFSSSLTTAMNNYMSLISSNISTFENYVDLLDTYESELLTLQNTLASQNTTLKTIQNSLDIEKNNSYSNTSTYNTLLTSQSNQQGLINATNASIASKQAQIDSVNSSIVTLQTTLSYSSNFTSLQMSELSNFIYENTLQLSSCSNEKELYRYAIDYLAQKSQLPISLDLDMISLFDTKDTQLDWSKVNLGDFVNVDVNELGYDYTELRIVSYSHSKTSNTLKITLSNSNELNTNLFSLGQIFKLANQVSTDTSINKDDYGKYIIDQPNILTNTSTINNTIQAGNVVINQRGFIGSDIGSSGALQILNDKIIISSDSFATFHTLLSGAGLYLETPDGLKRTVLSPQYGFQIDRKVSSVWNNVFYIDSGTGDLTMDGRLKVTGNNIVLLDAFQDTNGGKLQINDIYGNANVRIGSEGIGGTNIGGVLVLYSDSLTKPRVECAIDGVYDSGVVQVKDTNNVVRANISANSTAGAYLGIFNSSGVRVSYLSQTSGKINSQNIATEDWVMDWVSTHFVHS